MKDSGRKERKFTHIYNSMNMLRYFTRTQHTGFKRNENKKEKYLKNVEEKISNLRGKKNEFTKRKFEIYQMKKK